jgi:MFS family permease
MLSASLGVVFCSIPLFYLLEGGSIASVIGVRAVFIIFGVAFFAPFHAWAQQLIPSSYRYLIISLGYALGSQILGGPSVVFALWCFQKTGMIASVAWYWMFLGLVSSMAIVMTMRSKKKFPVGIRI